MSIEPQTYGLRLCSSRTRRPGNTRGLTTYLLRSQAADGADHLAEAGEADTSLVRSGALHVALDADEVWIWTDVDGVMTANPSEVPQARTLAEISYSEASELAYYGAKVLHYKTILPAFRKRIPVRILNSFNPGHPGTRVSVEGNPSASGVKAVTSIRKVALIAISGTGMQGIPGIVDLKKELHMATAQVEVEVDLEKALQYGLKPGDVRRAAAFLLQGEEVGDVLGLEEIRRAVRTVEHGDFPFAGVLGNQCARQTAERSSW